MLEIIEELISSVNRRIESEPGLAYFVTERLQFEGWLKVVVVTEINSVTAKLEQNANDVFARVEYELGTRKRIDIFVPNIIAVELKVIATNYAANCVKRKSKNITNQIDSLISDLEKLQAFRDRGHNEPIASFGVVFPLSPDNSQWLEHINRVKQSAEKGFPNLQYLQKELKLPCLRNQSGQNAQGVVFSFYSL